MRAVMSPRWRRSSDWAVVVPVKDFALAKSRVRGVASPVRRGLARALAHDMVSTASSAFGPQSCFVVGTAEVLAEMEGLSVNLVAEPQQGGLNAALAAGRDTAVAAGHSAVAIVVADLPLLTPIDLQWALGQVPAEGTAVVRDRDGRGTTLLASRPAELMRPAFGAGSAARHMDDGAIDLSSFVAEGVRFDVDLWEDIANVRARVCRQEGATAAWLRSVSMLPGTPSPRRSASPA